ncbi:19547_t:CDS:2, partial [Racocetra persica]
YFVDNLLKISVTKLVTNLEKNNFEEIYKNVEGDHDWKFIISYDIDNIRSSTIISIDNNEAIYLVNSRDNEFNAIFKLDINSKLQLIAKPPNQKADINKILFHPKTKNPIAYSVTYLKGELDMLSQSLDNLILTVSFQNVIKSRDNLDLVCYLTLPAEKHDPLTEYMLKNPLPLILQVHGSLWTRNYYIFKADSQLFANRGYAILNLNYNSSIGLGTIYGGSYGGFAILAGLAFTDKKEENFSFVYGVEFSGPANLFKLVRTIPPYWISSYDEFVYHLGSNPNTKEE